MKILLFGKDGMVGRAVHAQAAAFGHSIEAHGRNTADFTRPEACAEIVRQTRADAIIVAAAYTAVDAAETDRETAELVNATTPGAIASAAAQRDIPLVHISTDYVFSADHDRALQPGDSTDPVNAYGASKLAGENAVVAAGARHAIIRTSWIFSASGKNFVKTMIGLGENRGELNVVADQIGGPTSAAAVAQAGIAAATSLADGRSAGGIFHYAGEPHVSWADFAREIFRQTGQDVTVHDIATADYPTPAARPSNSRFDSSKAREEFALPICDWQKDLTDVIKELGKT